MPEVSVVLPTIDFTADVVIIGAGASGLTAALAAAENGAEVVGTGTFTAGIDDGIDDNAGAVVGK